jgi:hypothetical protein
LIEQQFFSDSPINLRLHPSTSQWPIKSEPTTKTTQHKDAKKNQNYFCKNVRKPKSVGQECGDLSFKKV